MMPTNFCPSLVTSFLPFLLDALPGRLSRSLISDVLGRCFMVPPPKLRHDPQDLYNYN
ncbi:hypothetical protein GE21DRAFT_1127774 [Neurospora crassa]|nr:hypothetical protein GE21DRAFT_1127774 [Neurospora crassa]